MSRCETPRLNHMQPTVICGAMAQVISPHCASMVDDEVPTSLASLLTLLRAPSPLVAGQADDAVRELPSALGKSRGRVRTG